VAPAIVLSSRLPYSQHRSLRLRSFLVLALLVLAAFLSRALWLPAFGYALVRDEGPARADIAVVLGGDYYGHRILKAAELVRQGYVPAVLVSGPPGFYGLHECDLAIPFAVRHGYPAQWFIPLPHNGLSTREEAQVVIAELRRRQVHTFLLVTSDYHTARAARTYRGLARGSLTLRPVAVPDEFFRADSWWHNREAKKLVLLEWLKTLTAPFGV
jgi:uncharacterized SAM-binding protein YcdF (DUF218 family)